MAERKSNKTSAKPGESPASPARIRAVWRRLRWRLLQALLVVVALILALIALYRFVNPPTTYTIWSESRRLGHVERQWVPAARIAPVMLRSAVAAEDANFCQHWGFDMRAIRLAMEDGAEHGASTISQQTVKNVFLWQGRSWPRKAVEALLTPAVEAIWNKRRILEVYLNVAEFGNGIFGVDAAARHYFHTTPDKLSPRQAALLAAILPDPKHRNPARPSKFVDRRARAIEHGAELIRHDGRAACFE